MADREVPGKEKGPRSTAAEQYAKRGKQMLIIPALRIPPESDPIVDRFQECAIDLGKQ